jgi:hypothetical protein
MDLVYFWHLVTLLKLVYFQNDQNPENERFINIQGVLKMAYNIYIT